MNVVDSSGWLEYFADAEHADIFAPLIADLENLVVPSICIYEVFKHVCVHRGEEEALQVVGVMSLGRLVAVDRQLAMNAAQIYLAHKLAMADSIILAISQAFSATLWTQDIGFKDIDGVNYIAK